MTISDILRREWQNGVPVTVLLSRGNRNFIIPVF